MAAERGKPKHRAGDPVVSTLERAAHLFRLELNQVVHSSLHPDGDRMVIRSWRPGSPITTVERV